MKQLIYCLLLLVIQAKAQDKLPEVRLSVKGDLHFVSPEPIQYVDISSKDIEGDLALPNLLRVRFKKDSCYTDAIVTIAGERFIAQYHLLPVSSTEDQKIEIQPADMRPLDISGIGLSHPQLNQLAYQVFCSHSSKIEQVKAFGLKATLNHIYSAGDYLFLDISYKNKTNLKYDIDAFRFKIDDKRVTKASNIQSVEIKPEFTLFDVPAFSKYYRNIFVLKKMSFPGNKVLHIELNEKQVSGRVITLQISYKDVLEADTLPAP
jgi:conjugative transposon TraN protein